MLHYLAPLAAYGFSLLFLAVLYCLGRIVVTLHGLSARSHFALRGVIK